MKEQTYWTRACKAGRVYDNTPSLRCSNCPFPECLKGKGKLALEILIKRQEELTKYFYWLRHD